VHGTGGARLDQAELQPELLQRRWLMTFVVVGGGFSGVETAGEVTDFLYARSRNRHLHNRHATQ
jgi:NADH dehydrogenase